MNKPAHEVLILIALLSNGSSGEPVQTPQSIHCSHTQTMDVDEDSDQNLDL